MDNQDVDEFALHAWVDESMRVARGEHEGQYLLAAVLADPAKCDLVRSTLRSLLLRGAHRLHWRDETTARRRKIAAAIGEQDLAHTVVVATPMDSRRQERARAVCMERLLFELDQVDIGRVWLESRHESLNRRDIRLVDALRTRAAISRDIIVSFARPKEEPMLWAPDAVAGAVNAARVGLDMDVRNELGHVEEIEVDPS